MVCIELTRTFLGYIYEKMHHCFRYGFKTAEPSGEKKSTQKKVREDRPITPIHKVVAVNRYHRKNYKEKNAKKSRRNY